MAPSLEDWFYIHYGIQLSLPGFMLMLAIAVSLACLAFLHLVRKRKLDEIRAYSFLCLAIPLLLAGAKIAYAAQFPHVLDGGWDFWWGPGVSLYGGLFGVLAAAQIVFRRIGVALPYLDALAPALAVGLIPGRLGCFLGGCNGGCPTALPWGVQFPAGSDTFLRQVALGLISDESWRSLPVHPTQLYEALLGLLLFVLGLWLLGRPGFSGRVFLVLLGSYAFFRFWEEFIRRDWGHLYLGLMTFAQIVSLLLLALCLLSTLILRGRRTVSESESRSAAPAVGETANGSSLPISRESGSPETASLAQGAP